MFAWFKSLFAERPWPSNELRHPELGLLTFDSGLWIGELQKAGRDIHFCIGGTDTSPDHGLLDRLRDVLARFDELERTALEFLCDEEPSVKQGDFHHYSLDFLWETKPDDFVFEFTLDGDMDGIWRVEFENGTPKSIGRDD